MSTRAMGAVWQACPPGLSDSARLVLLALADEADDAGRCPALSLTTERKTGKNRRAINRAMTALVEAGLAERVVHFRPDGARLPSTYRLILPGLLIPDSGGPPENQKVVMGSEPGPTDEASKQRQVLMDTIVTQWNTFAGAAGLKPVLKLTTQRRDRLKRRIVEWGVAPEQVMAQLLVKLGDCPFALGKNDHHWRVDFDWLIRNDTNWVRIEEGQWEREGLGKPRGHGRQEAGPGGSTAGRWVPDPFGGPDVWVSEERSE